MFCGKLSGGADSIPATASPLALIDVTPKTSPTLARLAPALLQLLADGGRAVEEHRGHGYWLQLLDPRGRFIWTNRTWLYAWEQLRRHGWVQCRCWIGPQTEYVLSEAGWEVLAGLGG